ncbi:hypothetical protein PR003_g14898 [Phytophthora rubi]|uniref:EF-hand domain-containing protein n=1 Tax=Phytophthora rubi TaxID=129364 RepID=A0A6A3LI43_9STRA|nr:hypothetical protein PR002_g14379 [Phytophthora rubi]KAE9018799.1 hypothetical protein PR001_g14042 [Phytophthora rubi]KAE9331671.1 hypothetical protein PR003_g14898 [Phytophthora rubi]
MLRRVVTSGAPNANCIVNSASQRVLHHHFSQTPGAPLLKAHAKTAKRSAAAALNSQARGLESAETQQTWHQAANGSVLSYWKSAALAAGACGALARLDEQNPTACAAGKGSDEDPVEQAKKKLQELSASAIAQIAALLPEDYSNLQKQVDEFLASGKGGQISWGFCMGACSGFALKKISKLGAVAIGTIFILLQCASYSGYVDVDYKKLERDVKSYLDINKDGVFDTKDLDSMYKSIMKVLEFNLPAGSGFVAGFVLGFRSG